MEYSISGKVVDVIAENIFPATIHIKDGIITEITPSTDVPDQYILPGLVDAHVHIESSMLIPSEFARLAVVHGTVATVSDPHEIANVLGIRGVEYMIDNAGKVPFYFNFGAPSCVPATGFETAGDSLDVKAVEKLLKSRDIKYLSEMMNYPGVLYEDEEVMQKIEAAKKYKKPVDGHAPGLKGQQAEKYAAAGISTDHECFTLEEALDKLRYGMKIIIREGSAAKNYDALKPLLKTHPQKVMFCSDDKHPDNLVEGHIDKLVQRAIKDGYDFFNIIRAATLNPVRHYSLEHGLVRKNDPATFIIVNNLKDFKVLSTYIDGIKVAEKGKTNIQRVDEKTINNFNVDRMKTEQLELKASTGRIHVIEAMDGQLVTNKITADAKIEDGLAVSDIENDILKMVVYNRYFPTPPAVGFIKNFGFKKGAIASSVAHDSHNIVAVGVSDEAITQAINLLVEVKGGVAAFSEEAQKVLPLPVAGLMSAGDGFEVAKEYEAIDKMAKSYGSTLSSPFMTLSFMALLVIPNLKLSDKGLFNGEQFSFEKLFVV